MLRTLFLMLASTMVMIVSFYGVLGSAQAAWRPPFFATTFFGGAVAMAITAVQLVKQMLGKAVGPASGPKPIYEAPSIEQYARAAINRDWAGIDPDLRTRLSAYLIEPVPAKVELLGTWEATCIVARIGRHVVFFDDLEEDFGTARKKGGRLVEAASCGNIALALRELERVAGLS